jgi:hypothetical protein
MVSYSLIYTTECYDMLQRSPIWTDAVEWPSQENMDVIFGTLNVQVLYGSGCLKIFEKTLV